MEKREEKKGKFGTETGGNHIGMANTRSNDITSVVFNASFCNYQSCWLKTKREQEHTIRYTHNFHSVIKWNETTAIAALPAAYYHWIGLQWNENKREKKLLRPQKEFAPNVFSLNGEGSWEKRRPNVGDSVDFEKKIMAKLLYSVDFQRVSVDDL